MEKGQEKMNEEMKNFLKKEFDITMEEIDYYEAEQICSLYEKCCDIETDEAFKGDPISRRGIIAAKVADYIYDTYADV